VCPFRRDTLNDPLVASHKYLLRYPLKPGEEELEGDLMPTMRVTTEADGAKVFTLPAPAYDDMGDNL
jgi:hypothetical protein